MNDISRIALHRRGILLGLAAGAGLAAIALGMGDARADNDTTEPAALLSTAAADLSQAHDLFTGTDHAVPASMQQFFDSEAQLPAGAEHLMTFTESIQEPLLTSNDSVVSELANIYFGGLDQQFATDSAAVLAGDQAFVADPSKITEIGVLIPDLELAGTELDSLGADFTAILADDLLGDHVALPDPTLPDPVV